MKMFSHPQCLMRLARFTLEAHCSVVRHNAKVKKIQTPITQKLKKIQTPLRITVIMPPTSKKLTGHIGFGLSVHPSIR